MSQVKIQRNRIASYIVVLCENSRSAQVCTEHDFVFIKYSGMVAEVLKYNVVSIQYKRGVC